MDRLFLIQRTYANDKYDPDGMIVYHLLKQYKMQNCDDVLLYDDFECPSNVLSRAKRMNNIIIPVGNIQYVKNGLTQIYGKDIPMRPIEVPDDLRGYCHREYQIMKGRNIPKNILYSPEMGRWFIKDADTLKGFTNVLCIGSCDQYIDDDKQYVISEKVHIISEYRVFVWKKEICAVQHYAGNPCVFPHEQTIKNMVKDYKNSPDAYTLDVIVIEKQHTIYTAVLEVHPFVSCGLYGFYDKRIPDMLEAGINWYVNK